MKILFNQVVSKHNIGLEGEASYRVQDFIETISIEKLNALQAITKECIEITHSPRYLQKVKGACKSKCHLAEVKLSEESLKAIVTSASMSILSAQTNNFAITRPPGHHAAKEKAQGFCFVNNIAVATTYLLQLGKKVCVVDIDGHFGNGTESIFRKNKNVLFCSVQQENIYPSCENPKVKATNKKIENGKTIVSLSAGSDDGDFIKVLQLFKEEIIKFSPDHIAISAGFDGYYKDQLLDLKLTKQGYYKAGKFFSSFNLPTFAVLEGGYHQDLKKCVEAFINGILHKL